MATLVISTNEDFSIEYTALRTQAVNHGLDPNTPEMTAFLQHTAEVMAQRAAQERFLYKILHPKF